MTTCHGRGATIALLLATAACSAGSTVAGPSDGGDDSGSSDATGAVDAPSEADDATSDAADGGALCPADVPEAGTPCSSPQPPFPFEAQCEYGADPHCTTTATCDKQWTVLPCPQSPTGCPAAFDAGAGGACAPVKGVCDYPQGQCGCLGCNGGAACPDLCGPDASPTGTVWQCASWPMPPGCPWPRPLLGTPCSGPPGNRVCDYGVGIFDTCSVPLDPRQACVGGRWVAYIAGG
jgi:hypothetical protein